MRPILSLGDNFRRTGLFNGKTCSEIILNRGEEIQAVHGKASSPGWTKDESGAVALPEMETGSGEFGQLGPSMRNFFGLSYMYLRMAKLNVLVLRICMSLVKFPFFLFIQGRFHSLAVRGCVCEIIGKLLTLFVFSCNILEIYRKKRRGVPLCDARVAVNVSVQGGGMEGRVVLNVWRAFLLVCVLWPFSALAENSYVGTAACKDCHEEQYENFTKYAKKSHSDRSVKIMASDLTEAELATCYGCHATGYGKPGGFVSYEKTPHLADAGCEVCHGPGYDHVESGGDAEFIKGKLTMEDCVDCHNEDRVKSFNFKPLLYGGAH
jgi:hypothetical protein